MLNVICFIIYSYMQYISIMTIVPINSENNFIAPFVLRNIVIWSFLLNFVLRQPGIIIQTSTIPRVLSLSLPKSFLTNGNNILCFKSVNQDLHYLHSLSSNVVTVIYCTVIEINVESMITLRTIFISFQSK